VTNVAELGFWIALWLVVFACGAWLFLRLFSAWAVRHDRIVRRRVRREWVHSPEREKEFDEWLAQSDHRRGKD